MMPVEKSAHLAQIREQSIQEAAPNVNDLSRLSGLAPAAFAPSEPVLNRNVLDFKRTRSQAEPKSDRCNHSAWCAGGAPAMLA